jgi:hypothetical protein
MKPPSIGRGKQILAAVPSHERSDPLSAGRGVRVSPMETTEEARLQVFRPRSTLTPSRMLYQKASRDVAMRRAYRRCVRNVSACSTDRQQ